MEKTEKPSPMTDAREPEISISEDQFAAAFDSSSTLMAIMRDEPRVLVEVNRQFLETTGYTKEEIIGKTPVEIGLYADPEDISRVKAMLTERGSVQNYDGRLRIKNGGIRWCILSVIPIDADGRFSWLTVMTDITERKRSEEWAQHQSTLLSSLLDSIPDVVFFKEVDGAYLGCNPHFAEFVGKPREQIIGQTDFELFGSDAALALREQERAMLKKGAPLHNEEWVTYPDGSRRLMDTFKAPLVSAEGTLIGLLGISRDVTERDKNRKELALRESYLSAIIENLPGLVWMKDRDSRLLAVNQAYARFCGAEKKELEGRASQDILLARVEAAYCADDHKVMDSREPVRFEAPVEDHGECRWVETFKTPVYNVRRDVIGTVGYTQDITERKAAQEKVERLNIIQGELMRLATGFVNVPISQQSDAIHEALKSIGVLIDACRAYLFSYDFENGVMSNTYEWCAEGVAPEIDNLQNLPVEFVPDWVHAHREGRELFVPDVQALAPNSALRMILEPQGIHSLITLPLMHENECMGFVGFDAVKTHRTWGESEIRLLHVLAEMLANLEVRRKTTVALRELNEELIRARDEAEAGARARSMFLANMSHEIRTPLNVVLGHAQIMQRNACSCNQEHFSKNCMKSLSAISSSGEHLLGLINDILALIETDTNGIKLSLSEFDFVRMLQAVKGMFSANIPRAVQLRSTLEDGVPAVLKADEVKVRQVLINLVGNALKFTAEGSVTIRVSSEGSNDGMLRVLIDVEDTGRGIEEEARGAVFAPFEQSESGKNLKRGTGLGLPLSQRYARAMGGDLFILKSAVGKGTIFRFMFRAEPGDVSGIEPSAKVMQGSENEQHVVRRTAREQEKALGAAVSLAEVPDALCDQLRTAVQLGNLKLMKRVVEEIGEQSPLPAAALDRLVRRYDYERLLQMLEESNEERDGD